MPQRLSNMEITKVSLVERGANGRTFAVLKSDVGEPPEADKRSLLAKVAAALGLTAPEPVGKNQTFASLVASQQLTEALDDDFWTLKDALWSAIYAYEDDELLPMADRQALVAQSLDEFKAYLIDRMNAGVTKAGVPTPDPLADGLLAAVRKVGKNSSAARLERLKSAADSLLAGLAEVEVSDDDADVEKENDMPLTDEDVTRIAKAVKASEEPSELEAAISKANEPILARLDALEKGQGAAPTATDDEGTIPESIGKVFDLLIDRLDQVEKALARGSQTSAEGQDETKLAKSSGWSSRM